MDASTAKAHDWLSVSPYSLKLKLLFTYNCFLYFQSSFSRVRRKTPVADPDMLKRINEDLISEVTSANELH